MNRDHVETILLFVQLKTINQQIHCHTRNRLEKEIKTMEREREK